MWRYPVYQFICWITLFLFKNDGGINDADFGYACFSSMQIVIKSVAICITVVNCNINTPRLVLSTPTRPNPTKPVVF